MKRIDIKLGYACNNKCRFCIIGNRREIIPDKPTSQVISELNFAKKKNADKVVITGGEPLIRKDIFKILSYASSLKFRVIHLESNSRMYSYPKVVDKVIASGANSFTVSLHAHEPKLYSYLSSTDESAFFQVINGIKNLRKKTEKIGINATITKLNYKFLTDIVKWAVELRIPSVHFPFINPFKMSPEECEELVPKFSEVEPFLQEAFIFAKNHSVITSTEMVPPCFIRNFEERVVELHPRNMEVLAPDYHEEDFDAEVWAGRSKSDSCRQCNFDLVCPGITYWYSKFYGVSELKPIKDKKPEDLEGF